MIQGGMNMVKAYGVTSGTNFYDTKVQQKKSTTDKVKNNVITEGIAKSSEDKLSSKAKAYLEELRNTYGDYDFIIADEGADRKELLNQSNKEYSVMFSSAELERMASDKDYAAEQMRKVQTIIDMSNRIFDKFNIERSWEEGAPGDAMLNKLAISVNDDGTMTILAEVEKFSEKKQSYLDKVKEKREEQKEKEEKIEEKAEDKKVNPYKKEDEASIKKTVLKASSEEELIEKIQNINWDKVIGETVGAKFDFSI